MSPPLALRDASAALAAAVDDFCFFRANSIRANHWTNRLKTSRLLESAMLISFLKSVFRL